MKDYRCDRVATGYSKLKEESVSQTEYIVYMTVVPLVFIA